MQKLSTTNQMVITGKKSNILAVQDIPSNFVRVSNGVMVPPLQPMTSSIPGTEPVVLP